MEDDSDARGERAWKELRKALPFRVFVRTWGPLESDRWVARLHRDADAQARLKRLLKPTGFSTPKGLKRLLTFIAAQPVLERHVKLAWGIQLAHLMRWITFGSRDAMEAPELKSAEWKGLHRKLSALLKRHGKGGLYLVRDEADEPGHKIEVSDPASLTPALLRGLRKALKGWKNAWYVVVTLDFDHPDLDPGLLVVWADQVDEVLDRAQLKAVLGPRFRI